MTKAAAVVFVLVATAVLLAITGVSPAELAIFALFELGFVLLPGLVAHAALAREPVDLLQRLSIGAGAGHAILLAAFIASAGVGARWALWLLPPLALAGAVSLARSGAWERRPSGFSNSQALALGGVALA